MKKIVSCAAVVGLLVASSSSVFAGGHGASSLSPGSQFNQFRNAGGPPAPVQNLPGASGWAPGHQTSTPTVTPPGNSTNGAAVYAPGFLKGH